MERIAAGLLKSKFITTSFLIKYYEQEFKQL